MTVKVDLSIGEHYPHLFVSTGPGDLGSPFAAVVELSDEDWAGWREAEDRYYEWVAKLDALRKSAT